MNDLFMVLLLVSIIGLVAGLVKPKLLGKVIKDPTRKKIGLYGGCAIVLFFILFGATAPKTSITGNKTTSIETVKTLTPEEHAKADDALAKKQTAEVAAEPAVTFNEVGSYQKAGETWSLVALSRTPTQEELKGVAKELHKKDTSKNYNIFDDNEKIEEYKNWDINYPSKKYEYPEAWTNAHLVGMINQMYSNGSMNWQLSNMDGQKIIDL